LIERLGWCLVHSVWQIAAVTVVAALVLKGLERRSSQARYLAACLALLTMAILPIATFSLAERPAKNSGTTHASAARTASNPAPDLSQAAQSVSDEEPEARSSTIDAAVNRDGHSVDADPSRREVLLKPLLQWLVVAWGVGVLVLSLRLLGGWVWIQWLVRHETTPVAERLSQVLARLKSRMQIARTVRLLESARVQVPLAISWMRPVILLPVTAVTGLPSDQLEARNLGWRALWAHKTGLRPARVLPRDDTKAFGFDSEQAVRITLDPPISSTVRVLDPKGIPVAGGKVAVVLLNDGRSILPDELSEALALPGSQSYLDLSEPKAYLKRGRGIETTIGEHDGQTLAPIELERGVTLRGIVVDEAGKPVAAAEVQGKWQIITPANSPDHPGMSFGSTFSAAATTDAHGQFVLEGIHPGANVMLEASANEARTDRPTPAAASAAMPARLVISGANTVSLVGRVVDPADQPIAGALVQIRSRPLRDDGHPDPGPIRFDASEIRTESDGRFRTPRQLKRGYGYRAEIKSLDDTFMPESTPWLAFKTGTRPFFPKIVLRRLWTVHGRVVDSRGKPVALASVRQAGDGPAPTLVVTDADGRFALGGILAGPSFVFVVKDGYRFEGKPICAAEPSLEVVLTRTDEGFIKPITGSIPTLARAEELAILHRVFDGYAERVIKEGAADELFAVLRILVWLDPVRTTELLGDQRLGQWQPNNIRLSLAVRLVGESEQEARALIEAIPDVNMRSYAYSEVSAALPEKAQARKLALLDESLIAGRAVVDAESRVLRLADIGGRLFDLGRTAEATNLVREAQAIAAWARGRLAEELAQADLPAALNLLEGTEGVRDHGEYLGRIAHELAGRTPAEAERVLMMMHDVWPHFRDEYTEMRTLALRPPIPGPKGREGISDIASALMASLFARYDRAISRQILDGFAEGAIRRRVGLDDWGSMFKGEEVFEAMAVVDPARAAAMIDSLPESSGLSTGELKNAARLSIARILARPENERRRDVEQHMLHLWRIDSEGDEF